MEYDVANSGNTTDEGKIRSKDIEILTELRERLVIKP